MQCEPENHGKSIKEMIQEAINESDPNINIGIKIRDITTGQVVYERNTNRYFTFASALKVITATALGQYFGNDYKFIDKISQKDDDFYLNINDPSFSNNDLDYLLKLLKTQISTKPRNFYIVNSNFSLSPLIDTKMIEDTKDCDGAQITKVHINKNCLHLQLISNKSSVRVNNSETIPYNIINNVQIVHNDYEDDLEVTIKNDYLIMSGTLRENSTISLAVVAFDHLNYVRLSLKQLLIENNIEINGKIAYGLEPEGAKAIVKMHKPFYDIASAALKISDNFVLDYFLAEFADVFNVKKWENAGVLVKKYVFDEFGVNLDKSVMVDGSGISRYNIFTPAQFDELLGKLYTHRQFEIIKLMLVQPGTGTLTHRFRGVKMFAKTGTLFGVSSLVGYVYNKNNTPYSFVIVSNNYLGTKHKYADLEEKIIRILIN